LGVSDAAGRLDRRPPHRAPQLRTSLQDGLPTDHTPPDWTFPHRIHYTTTCPAATTTYTYHADSFRRYRCGLPEPLRADLYGGRFVYRAATGRRVTAGCRITWITLPLNTATGFIFCYPSGWLLLCNREQFPVPFPLVTAVVTYPTHPPLLGPAAGRTELVVPAAMAPALPYYYPRFHLFW